MHGEPTVSAYSSLTFLQDVSSLTVAVLDVAVNSYSRFPSAICILWMDAHAVHVYLYILSYVSICRDLLGLVQQADAGRTDFLGELVNGERERRIFTLYSKGVLTK